MLAAYLHQLSPFAIELSPGIGVRWYGLSYIVGFLLAFLLLKVLVRRCVTTLKPHEIAELIFQLAVGVVLGGRLGYVFFYDPSLLWTFSNQLPYWNALAINQGGMASHGGMIGAVVAGGWYAYRHQHHWGHLLDMAALATPIGLGMGRIANFVNGELYGRPCARDFPLAVQFPTEMQHWSDAQINTFHQLTGLRLFSDVSYEQVMHLLYQGDAKVMAALQQLLTPRHPSQLYQALAEGVVLLMVLLLVAYKPRKPWLIGGMFLITYAVLRVITEQFREPDAHLGYQLFNLTRGQWLSLGLAVGGLFLMFLACKTKAPAMGGWGRKV